MTGCRITAILADSEDRSVKVTARYYPPTEAYFDRSFGNWLPPEGDEVELLSVVALDPGADVERVEADVERVEEAIRVAWREED